MLKRRRRQLIHTVTGREGAAAGRTGGAARLAARSQQLLQGVQAGRYGGRAAGGPAAAAAYGIPVIDKGEVCR